MMGKKEQSAGSAHQRLIGRRGFLRIISIATWSARWITRGMREFVQESYAGKGQPSIDPVVFFKLQLVMFFCAPFNVVRHFCAAGKDGRGILEVRWPTLR